MRAMAASRWRFPAWATTTPSSTLPVRRRISMAISRSTWRTPTPGTPSRWMSSPTTARILPRPRPILTLTLILIPTLTPNRSRATCLSSSGMPGRWICWMEQSLRSSAPTATLSAPFPRWAARFLFPIWSPVTTRSTSGYHPEIIFSVRSPPET